MEQLAKQSTRRVKAVPVGPPFTIAATNHQGVTGLLRAQLVVQPGHRLSIR